MALGLPRLARPAHIAGLPPSAAQGQRGSPHAGEIAVHDRGAADTKKMRGGGRDSKVLRSPRGGAVCFSGVRRGTAGPQSHWADLTHGRGAGVEWRTPADSAAGRTTAHRR